MTQYNILNVKLSNSQINRLKFRIKNGTEVTLKLSSNVFRDSNDETNFLHKSLFTNTQVSRLHIGFANSSSASIKLSKTQLHKIGQSAGFLGRPLGPFLKTGMSLLKDVIKPLSKSVLGLTAAAATDAAFKKKILGSDLTTHIISNEEMDDIMKIVKSLKEFRLLIKGISETIQNKAKEQKGAFLSMFLGTLGASLLGYLLTGKEVKRLNSSNIPGRRVIRGCKGKIRAGENFQYRIIL